MFVEWMNEWMDGCDEFDGIILQSGPSLSQGPDPMNELGSPCFCGTCFILQQPPCPLCVACGGHNPEYLNVVRKREHEIRHQDTKILQPYLSLITHEILDKPFNLTGLSFL